MIEGLRVAPAYLDARADNRVPKSCDECRAMTTTTTRQDMGCGYEAPIEAPASVWSPPYHLATVCPGYTTSLTAVVECYPAYAQWEQRTLTEYLGEPPTEIALMYLAELRGGINEHQAAETRRRAKGPG